MVPSRKSLFLIIVAGMAATTGGCATFEDFLGAARGDASGVATRALKKKPVEPAIDANRFTIAGTEQSVVGRPQVAFTRSENTLADFAREYGLGYDELLAANPDVDPWLPGDGAPVLLPTQFVLPDVPRRGVVLNIASKRLFYFPEDGIERDADTGEVLRQLVMTFPIGIGRVGWETPLGSTTVVSKARDPSWWVPLSVRREHAELGDPLPAVVPPGPDNPLGSRVLKLEMPGYLIHGTNQPYGVGMRVSHGCVRLYPENIELLYELVDIGESVTIINEPYLIGRIGNDWYFEAHAPLEDDTVTAAERLEALFASLDGALNPHLEDHVRAIASAASGVPIRIAEYDDAEVFARVRHVENTIETDPEAPTLEEVRQMIDEAVAEAEQEEEGA